MEKFITTQTKTNDVLTESVSQLTSRVEAISTHQKMMETQIAQIAQQVNHLSRPQGHFPGQPETNPKGQMNAIILRSGKELEGPQVSMKEATPEAPDESSTAQDTPPEAPNERVHTEETQEAPTERVSPPVKPYRPPVPYPQRLIRAKEEHKYGKFLEMLKKFHINIPFLEAITDMPSYAKFLKDLLSNKGKLLENATVALTEECSAIIQNKLPPKLTDPGSFSIPCSVGDVAISRALCDLGASVSLMPYSICQKLQVGELKPTTISLQLADRSVKHPLGVLEDVPLQVGKFFIPCDFVIMEMEEDARIPIILGRPFLATAGAMIDVKHGKLSLQVGDEKIEFSLPHAMTSPASSDSCCRVDVLEKTLNQEGTALHSVEDPLEAALIDCYATDHPSGEREEPFSQGSSQTELKPLPSHLRYEFLDLDHKFPVVVSSRLDGPQLKRLMDVLKQHRGALGYSVDDIKGLSPSFCMHRILLNEGHRPS